MCTISGGLKEFKENHNHKKYMEITTIEKTAVFEILNLTLMANIQGITSYAEDLLSK